MSFRCDLGFHNWVCRSRSESGGGVTWEDECSRCKLVYYGCNWAEGSYYQPVAKGICHLCRGSGTVEDADGGPVPMWGNMVVCYHCDGKGTV